MGIKKVIYTVQHTESVHHTNGHVGAWGDWPLSERGMEQARAVGRALAAEGVDGSYVMYCSDLQRAVMTAAGINETIHLTPEYLPIIREVNAGEGNGRPYEWFAANRAPQNGYDPDYRPFPDAESDRDVWKRLTPFYEMITKNEASRIVVVSHGTALGFLQEMLCGLRFEDVTGHRFHGRAGSVCRFTIGDDGRINTEYINRLYC